MVENGPGSARRLLGVFAHPDDEVFCASGCAAAVAACATLLGGLQALTGTF